MLIVKNKPSFEVRVTNLFQKRKQAVKLYRFFAERQGRFIDMTLLKKDTFSVFLYKLLIKIVLTIRKCLKYHNKSFKYK
ncbi:hypothetical protein BG590_01205 [Mannheimia haemolytica]|nr:hypothetical protein N220_01225 [Mannheimia haemolytica USMARC_2286]AKA12510.1 hypothetical protein WC39_12840 [Mannheimia haemolytica]ASW16668.1 hypothetical protein D650_28320 [Mannheimia haemolytica USDA-ARS-USMARC-183]ASW16730.1 hypothetical protein D648_26380 [Mannheimia haemolytica USDA-ARS-USMARC-185]AWW72502.1 hypothetical protein C4O86_12235 [Pasteurellaceae bacterium 12565]EME04080.1 hypothetical protein F388_03820 [Mannheimia haemolytica serotype 6 str. H23]EPZ00401.1 hypothetic